MQYCLCGSHQFYSNCCGVFISGKALPKTPESVMRSRYVAYTQMNMNYIAKTMKAPASDGFDLESTYAWAKTITWTKLKVIQSSQNDKQGFVEFVADYVVDGKKYILHEISEFHFENDEWFYVDGVIPKRR